MFKFFPRAPRPTPALPDPDFGSLKHDGDQWVGEYDTGGPEPTGVLVGAANSGPSAQQRRQFLDFREAYPALEPRILAFIDPDGTAPPGDW